MKIAFNLVVIGICCLLKTCIATVSTEAVELAFELFGDKTGYMDHAGFHSFVDKLEIKGKFNKKETFSAILKHGDPKNTKTNITPVKLQSWCNANPGHILTKAIETKYEKVNEESDDLDMTASDAVIKKYGKPKDGISYENYQKLIKDLSVKSSKSTFDDIGKYKSQPGLACLFFPSFSVKPNTPSDSENIINSYQLASWCKDNRGHEVAKKIQQTFGAK